MRSARSLTFALLAALFVALGPAAGMLGAGDPPGSAAPPGVDAVRWPLPFPVPVALAPLPEGGLLVASLVDGKVWRVGSGGAVGPAVITLPSSPPTGEFGLLGLTLGPDYPREPWVYAFYTEKPLASALRFQSIVRFSLPPGAAQAGPAEAVVAGLTTGALCCHNGGRVAFGPDGMLYATVGDNMVGPVAQFPYSVAGKVLRYTPTGGIPADNPFPGSPVAVLGMRNTFGLTFDPHWGMVATDNGPSGFDGIEGADEVNLLQVGDNGGWPASRGAVCLPLHVCPVWQSGNAHLGPTGVVVPRGSLAPAWDGKVLWCNVNNDQAWLVDPAAAGPQPSVAFAGCSYDVAQDAQGRLVFATDNALWVVG